MRFYEDENGECAWYRATLADYDVRVLGFDFRFSGQVDYWPAKDKIEVTDWPTSEVMVLTDKDMWAEVIGPFLNSRPEGQNCTWRYHIDAAICKKVGSEHTAWEPVERVDPSEDDNPGFAGDR